MATARHRRWRYNRRSALAAATIGADRYGYAYDSIGNRLWSVANAVTNSYTANCLNQYTEFTHDADGNMTQCGDWTYTYDVANRLKTASSNGVLIVTNFYDAKSRRVKKVTPEATATFFYDGWNLIEERIAYTNGTTTTIRYFWGKDISGSLQGAGGVEGLLAVSMDGVFYIPCYDHNGNIVLYVSEDGIIAAQYTYDPYGNVTEQSGNLTSQFSFGFSTKYHDREIGMLVYQRRFLLPALGRWLNRDPIEEKGGENLYALCFNKTPFLFDVLGTKTCCRNGQQISCDNTYRWTGNVTVASASLWLGATFLMIDLTSNYICSSCSRYRLHAKAVLLTAAAGAPISLTGSQVDFGDVPPDAFVGSVEYWAAGFGAMGVVEASHLRLGTATVNSIGVVGGGEIGAGVAYGWYVDFELIEE